MGKLTGKVALVTGAGRGLGRSCAETFAREGASVVVVDIREAEGKETVGSIEERGGKALFIEADVSKAADVRRMVDETVRHFGGLDCAINNAVCPIGRYPLAEIPEDLWEQSIAVNLSGVFLCMKYEIQAMLKRGGGSLVNIGSGNEFGCAPGLAWYLAAKHGIYGMTKVAAMDYAKSGIRINAVGPGVMTTPAMEEAMRTEPNHKAFVERLCPTGKIAHPDNVAEAAVWLCSDAAAFVIGHTLVVDGGAGLV